MPDKKDVIAKRILLVDDDTQILETAQDILEAEGFAVRTAVTGEKALESLRQHPCDVMVVDYNLKDATGIELAPKAKAICPELVIFLMTGEAQVELGAAQGLIQAVLTKPVNPSDLIHLI